MRRSLNFCMITTFYPPYSFGGDATYVYHFANALARRGHWVDVIHCADAYRVLRRMEPEADYPNHPNVTVHTLRSPVGRLSPLATQQTGLPLFKAKKIRAILASKRFDVIHFHNVSLVGGPGILRYGAGIKLYTTHEYWLVCPMHVLWKHNREVCTKPSCIRCSLVYKRPPQWWRYTGLLERALEHVDAFIAPSRFTLAKHQEMGLQIPMVRIPNFLPQPPDALREAAPVDGRPARPYFLFVGRLEKLKGLHTVLPVFRRYPYADLLVAGEGTYGDTLRQLARDLPQVKFLGRVTHDQLPQFYRRAIAVVVPSIGYEVFGIVILEAFAERTPVITYDLGGTAEVVRESCGGIIYRTETELLRAMETLRNDAELRRHLGQQGYAAYLQHWSEEAHLRQYFSLLAEVARRKPQFAEVAELCASAIAGVEVK